MPAATAPAGHGPKATKFVLTAVEQALTLRQHVPGLFIHTDRGCLHTSAARRTRIERAKAVPSFSGPDNPYDNA